MAVDPENQAPPPSHLEFHLWRGSVNNQLESLTEKVDLLRQESATDRQAIRREIREERLATKTEISKLGAKIDKLEKGLSNGNSPYVTWDYIRDKIAIPVVVAAILFGLLTLCPWLLIVGYVVTGGLP